MGSTQKLAPVDKSLYLYHDSLRSLSLLIKELQEGLDDAITMARLKFLCEAIADEIEKADLLCERSKAA